MQSENFRNMLEELKVTKTRVKIYLVHGFGRTGHIVEVREDCLLLEKQTGSERIDYVIPFHAISSVDIKH
jgi:sRNA-binding regulator protein Hfq